MILIDDDSVQVIGINGEFPGPRIAARTNDVIEVNVFNRLDEPLLFTWFAPFPTSIAYIKMLWILASLSK